MFPDEMGIGEEDKTVQLVLIYGSIAVLYLVVAYIMFFRSFLITTLFVSEQILFRRRPNDKKEPVAKGDSETKKTEEPKKDKKMKKNEWLPEKER